MKTNTADGNSKGSLGQQHVITRFGSWPGQVWASCWRNTMFPTPLENFVVSEQFLNISWASCPQGALSGRAFLEGAWRKPGQTTLLERSWWPKGWLRFLASWWWMCLQRLGNNPPQPWNYLLPRAQGLEKISIIIFSLTLYISSRQVGFSIGAWADSYPFSAPLGLSL